MEKQKLIKRTELEEFISDFTERHFKRGPLLRTAYRYCFDGIDDLFWTNLRQIVFFYDKEQRKFVNNHNMTKIFLLHRFTDWLEAEDVFDAIYYLDGLMLSYDGNSYASEAILKFQMLIWAIWGYNSKFKNTPLHSANYLRNKRKQQKRNNYEGND